MQILTTLRGDDVAIMESRETLIVESALLAYVLQNPDSNLAVRVLRDVSQANEARMAQMDADGDAYVGAAVEPTPGDTGCE